MLFDHRQGGSRYPSDVERRHSVHQDLSNETVSVIPPAELAP